ncbi:hypothetical protein J4461_03145 [Candidatus Pacearchaeota archaeon]|nr:hypothetical protein [Candidatus Pacearchaeota archaeon]
MSRTLDIITSTFGIAGCCISLVGLIHKDLQTPKKSDFLDSVKYREATKMHNKEFDIYSGGIILSSVIGAYGLRRKINNAYFTI